MVRLFAFLALLATSATATADFICIDVVPIERGFTSALTPEPTDIWAYVVSENPNTDPIFSLDLSIPGEMIPFAGEFVNVAGGAPMRNTSGSVLVAGIIPAADTYFSVPSTIDPVNIAVAPGTAIDSANELSAAFTVTGDTPILAAGETGVTIATLAVPAGVAPPVPFFFGTGAVRTAAGPVLVPVGCVPEPSSALIATAALAGLAVRRRV